jgi:dTDP-4-dehydrorhamnose 3,5-epimerase
LNKQKLARATTSVELTLEDFVADQPFRKAGAISSRGAVTISDLIEGVALVPLTLNSDDRGGLCELLTTRDGPIEPIVHVYQVFAAPGSIRAWVYHRHQYDRLAYTMGDFEVVLYDIRPESPTLGTLNVLKLGESQPSLLHIPPFVIHGVKNVSSTWAFFINMPTRTYDPAAPDKCRIPWDDPRVPHSFR